MILINSRILHLDNMDVISDGNNDYVDENDRFLGDIE
jgi:hypothetical protein